MCKHQLRHSQHAVKYTFNQDRHFLFTNYLLLNRNYIFLNETSLKCTKGGLFKSIGVNNIYVMHDDITLPWGW